jgi:3'-phosphoadenosine 5'-phosphosulfate sulfotransferase (PAPS reductase)/FAD synthetase
MHLRDYFGCRQSPSLNRVKSALHSLIDESITIIREVAAEFERPVMLFSGGKDSVVMLHLAVRAFSPARVPFPVMHIDTGHNFAEVIEFRDRAVRDLDVQLIIGSVQASIDAGRIQDATGPRASRNPLQTKNASIRIATHSVSGTQKHSDQNFGESTTVVTNRANTSEFFQFQIGPN